MPALTVDQALKNRINVQSFPPEGFDKLTTAGKARVLGRWLVLVGRNSPSPSPSPYKTLCLYL